ncbi:MAG: T9SS type A sorting domain-containing protein [Flavobacteriales bacterium]
MNFSAILDNSTFGYPDALLFDDTVASYFHFNPGVLGTFVSSGQFNGMGNRYLGMRINAASDAFYGWFYINCSRNRDTIIIRTAAYNTTPWEGINAGQTFITGSDEIASSGVQISLFPNPANDQLYISSSSTSSLFSFPLAYKILDSRGSVVSSAFTNGIVKLSDLPNGIYHLQLEGSDQYTAKTFLISR